jgi:hypothetical protein
LPVKMRAVIEALQSLRGIAQISTVSIMAEVGELSRFAHPRQLMGYSGAVCREHRAVHASAAGRSARLATRICGASRWRRPGLIGTVPRSARRSRRDNGAPGPP